MNTLDLKPFPMTTHILRKCLCKDQESSTQLALRRTAGQHRAVIPRRLSARIRSNSSMASPSRPIPRRLSAVNRLYQASPSNIEGGYRDRHKWERGRYRCTLSRERDAILIIRRDRERYASLRTIHADVNGRCVEREKVGVEGPSSTAAGRSSFPATMPPPPRLAARERRERDSSP